MIHTERSQFVTAVMRLWSCPAAHSMRSSRFLFPSLSLTQFPFLKTYLYITQVSLEFDVLKRIYKDSVLLTSESCNKFGENSLQNHLIGMHHFIRFSKMENKKKKHSLHFSQKGCNWNFHRISLNFTIYIKKTTIFLSQKKKNEKNF